MAVLEMSNHFTAGGTGPSPNVEIMLRLRYAMSLRGEPSQHIKRIFHGPQKHTVNAGDIA